MSLYTLLGTVLVFNLIVTALFILRNQTRSGKMLVTLLLSTTGVGVMFLLYGLTEQRAILDVALVIVLLSSVTAIVFAKRLRYQEGAEDAE
ncbi:MAG TPA: monovalent cation/H+ antiporter complex subunit F [Sulfurovum sp.]|uniref:monovalent cation/H+ antiporter complex subunit F n=1 Tax=Sulfurovum sp. TaxID=1969726 RepID=UPI002F95168A